MRLICLFLFILLVAPAVHAATITLIASDGANFSGLPAIVESNNEKYTTYVGSNNEIEVETTQFTVYVKKQKIYAGHATNNQVLLRPIAKISGSVIDQRDNLLQHVPLKFLCEGFLPTNIPTQTDDLGFFALEEVGFGPCEIHAIVDEKVTTYTLEVNESKHFVITIQIEEEKSNLGVLALFVLVLIILVLLILFFRRQPQVSKKTEKGPIKDKAKKFSKRQEEIMTTLSERERLLVTDLFYSGKLTQSQLRHKTQLPKSTLHRTIQALEQKNLLLQVEESGVKKIKLTEFFLQS